MAEIEHPWVSEIIPKPSRQDVFRFLLFDNILPIGTFLADVQIQNHSRAAIKVKTRAVIKVKKGGDEKQVQKVMEACIF